MTRTMFFALAVAAAGAADAQSAARPDPRDPSAPVAPAAYRSAFEAYRPYADPQLADWRKSNEDVAAAGGHAGMHAGQGGGKQTSKPQPGTPESSGKSAKEGRAPSRDGGGARHGGHHK